MTYEALLHLAWCYVTENIGSPRKKNFCVLTIDMVGLGRLVVYYNPFITQTDYKSWFEINGPVTKNNKRKHMGTHANHKSSKVDSGYYICTIFWQFIIVESKLWTWRLNHSFNCYSFSDNWTAFEQHAIKPSLTHLALSKSLGVNQVFPICCQCRSSFRAYHWREFLSQS